MGKHLKTLIKEKPEGATHFDKGYRWYLDCSGYEWKKYDENKGWVRFPFRNNGRLLVQV